MALTREGMLAELKKLRRGRGVMERSLGPRTGPQLRSLCAIEPQDGTAEIRAKLEARLRALTGRLPEDLQLASLAALALHPDAQHRFVQDRILWLAGRIDRDERTARRRVDEALERLAETATAAAPVSPTAGETRPATDDWYVRSYRALLRLDTPTPELIDERTVVFGRDGLGTIVASLGLPRQTGDTASEHLLSAEMLYGGRISRANQPSDAFFRFDLELPRQFQAGESHDYGIVFRIPPGQPIRPHFAFVPLHPCRSFDLRVRFPSGTPPEAVWLLDGVPPRMLDEHKQIGELVAPDRFGDLRIAFTSMSLGLAYGVGWNPALDT